MGNICSDVEGQGSSAGKAAFLPSNQVSSKPKRMSKLIRPVGSGDHDDNDEPFTSPSSPQEQSVGRSNGGSKSIKGDTIITSIPSSISSSFDHLLDYSDNYCLSFDSQSPIMVDFSRHDYRAFCLLVHRSYGAIMLHCTRKKKKPPHYQLPGGHVDGVEFNQVKRQLRTISTTSTKSSSSSSSHASLLSTKVTMEELYMAARIGCAREVYEETGLDFRDVTIDDGQHTSDNNRRIERFRPLVLYEPKSYQEKHREWQQQLENDKGSTQLSTIPLINEYKHRLLFICEVFDDDFEKSSQSTSGSVRYKALPRDYSCNLTLQLSVEHTGFIFEINPQKVVDELHLHSGGKLQQAVEMALKVAAQTQNLAG